MSTRDDASLTARERAALASLAAVAAAEDPQLARRLRGASRRRAVPQLLRIPGWMRSRWLAGPLVVVGLALVVVGLSVTVVLGVAGAAIAACGLWLTARAIQSRWFVARPPD